ncbi:hypothetical protein M3Y94_01214300 [Aphelenchoides besseyi]|nr:hypothetical protein M3Y94_01214300 [Aphelenchoides besseyi]KAI6228551.1 Testicular acid phosphatase-like protein [Aphelenchoides besseyi]
MELKLFFLFMFISAANSSKLRFVQTIWRHGDRAPNSLPYPNDKYNESYWPRGWSQLTNLGMIQMKELGTFFRQRYVGSFLSKNYNHKEIYVRSSDSPRALTSAQSLLNGLYPPNPTEIFETGLNWHPIPVHASDPQSDDPLLKPTSFECPSYTNASLRLNAKFHSELTTKYSELFEFLGNVTGHGPNITLHQVAKLNDLNRELKHNLSQPDWISRLWPQFQNKTTLELISELKRLERTSQFNQPELSRLRGGFLLGDWLNRTEDVISGKQKKPTKMILYSSHDGTVQSLMYVMGIADHQQIPYAAAVIMEIHEENDRHFVRLFYQHSGQTIPKKLKDCEWDCEVTKFTSLLDVSAIRNRDSLNTICEIKTLQKAVELCDQTNDTERSFVFHYLLIVVFCLSALKDF